MSYNLVLTKPSIVIGIAIVSPVPSTIIRTHCGSMDVSNMIKRELILQEEKNRRNSLGLCYYCSGPGYIAIDHKNSDMLATKRQAANVLTGNMITLVSYKPLLIEEKKTSLD